MKSKLKKVKPLQLDETAPRLRQRSLPRVRDTRNEAHQRSSWWCVKPPRAAPAPDSTHLVLLLPLEALRLLRVLSRPRSLSPDSLVDALSLDRSFDFSSDLSLRLVGEGALQGQVTEDVV